MSIFPQWLINLCDQAQSLFMFQSNTCLWFGIVENLYVVILFLMPRKKSKITENVFIIIIVLLMSINISRLQCNCYPVYWGCVANKIANRSTFSDIIILFTNYY